jgi:L-lactate dehydrogenase complex protein LldG
VTSPSTSGAKAEMLARIRRALPAERVTVAVPRAYRRAGESASSPDLEVLLADRLADYRASVHHASATEAPATLARILAERGIEAVILPDGFPLALIASSGVPAISDANLSTAELDRCQATVSTCAVAIAETGTIVLDAGAGQGRRALSLVPDYLLIVIRRSQIVANVADGVAAVDPERPLTWISGPSATSDIELKRVEGVHGPRTLDVLITD